MAVYPAFSITPTYMFARSAHTICIQTAMQSLAYPNPDISETTRNYWVITGLQGMDNLLVDLYS